ncbi:MAG TPA: phospholipid carrier-dependent glycosyltransferase [Anaerolineae bacterium]|nr:phospholipid carrier-dependent glycosyltransferase [Anaerolineae bacterium]
MNRGKWLGPARWVGVFLLLAILLAQMAASSVRKSAAFDETYHLISGYAYLRTGSPRLSWEHPPVAQMLAALPLLARDDLAPFPLDHPAWRAGDAEALVDDYLWVDNRSRAPGLIWAGRLPLMGLTVLFGLALFAAIRAAVGEPAAWVGLTLFALDPNVIGNGRLITNDLPMAGLMFISVWRLGAYLRKPTSLNLLATGLAAGLAVATKVSAVILAPIFLLVILVYPTGGVGGGVGGHGGPPLRMGRRLLALVGMAGVAALTVWAVFGFEIGPVREGGVPLPAPTFLHGIPRVWQRIARGTPTYLLGRVNDTGWWYYCLVIFALKTPLPTLLLLAAGLVHAARRWRESALWWIPAGLYLGVASASTLQIGYRYILPVLLFAFPLAAAPFAAWPRSRPARGGLVLLVAWAVLEAALIFPDHLSYVNELGGGVDNGWRIFADMNVDWGQDLVALGEYVEAHSVDDLRLAYFGSAYPVAYGVQAHLLPGFSRAMWGPEVAGFNPYTPPPGTYAISATSLHLGLIYRGQDLYAFFRDRVPDGRAGRSILIYRIDYPSETPVDRAVVIGPDVWGLSPEELGLQEGHRLVTKWAGPGAFVLAAGGPARYLVQAPVPDSPLVGAVLGDGPPADGRSLLTRIPVDGVLAAPDGTPVPLPASFRDGPSLAGWTRSADGVIPGQSLTLVTCWRVEGPLTPPLAVFVHLLGEDGLPIAQWDGWPVATEGLEPGDLIVLSHPLQVPAETQPGRYVVQLGLYRPPHGPRLPVAGADRLILPPLAVEVP